MRARVGVLSIVLSVIVSPAWAGERVVSLCALEWPPYASQELSEQGTLSDTLRRAFAAMGYTLALEFLPQRGRELKSDETNPACMGYFPERYTGKLDRRWTVSEPIGGSPLGFAQRSDSPINWRSLDNLRNRRIGVVLDTIASTPLEPLVDRGAFKVDYATDDVANLVRLCTYRVDLAVTDAYVFAHLMANDPRLAEYRGQIVMNARIFQLKSLHVLFRKNAEGRRLAKVLASGLKKTGFEPPVFSPD